ncbi:hypothetical protein ACHAWF_011119 [Thalassiosira exigua]
MDPNDADANEDAARRIQEQLWMAEAADHDDDADADEDEGAAGNRDGDEGDGAVQDFMRQLLDRDGGDDGDGGGGDDDDAGNNDNDGAGDDDDEDDDDEDDDLAERRRGAIDGGIAGDVRDDHGARIARTHKCPLVLYFESREGLEELCPDNPVLRPRATAFVGLDKNTKLSVVFDRYVKFVNSRAPKGIRGKASSLPVRTSDLEFLHCAVLDANQTVEASAMMKNDRIRVHRDRGRERRERAEVLRQQRESDRKYFRDLRQLLPNPAPEGTRGRGADDVVLDCRGRVVDERGFRQDVLATTVRANSVLLAKRCKWLGRKVAEAREDLRRRAEMTVPSDRDEEAKSAGSGNGGNEEGGGRDDDGDVDADGDAEDLKSGQSDDEDDIIMAESRAGNDGNGDGNSNNNNDNNDNNVAAGEGGLGSAAKVEDDDDDDDTVVAAEAKSSNGAGCGPTRKSADFHHASSSAASSTSPNSAWVTLDHSPQAVKLLLEYCYTNRVQSLGQEAFVKSSKYPSAREVGALAAKQSGPVPPFKRHEWPDLGHPTVSLHLALAGIALAEEAHLPRLSLMCEVAASQLVTTKNVVDALGACAVQRANTGNRLPLLRKAAMLDCVMAGGSAGIDHLCANPNFKSGLDERRGLVVPSLLDGTVEVMPANMNTKDIKRKKDRMALERKRSFERADNSDKHTRVMERLKWRNTATVARRTEVAYGPPARTFRGGGGVGGAGAGAAFAGFASPDPTVKGIWRDRYQRDPPPPGGGGGVAGRGTKRKSSSRGGGGGGGADAGGAAGGGRNVRRRQARKRNHHLA